MRPRTAGSNAHSFQDRKVRFTLILAVGGFVAGLFGAYSIPVVRAQASPEAIQGEQVAAKNCAKCHAIGQSGESPQNRVPPFRTFKSIFPVEMLTKALTTGVIAGHEEMPMRELGFSDVRALLVYIDSLDAKGPQYITTAR